MFASPDRICAAIMLDWINFSDLPLHCLCSLFNVEMSNIPHITTVIQTQTPFRRFQHHISVYHDATHDYKPMYSNFYSCNKTDSWA